MNERLTPNDVLARWLLSWVQEVGAETPLDLVHRLWRLDHEDAGIHLKSNEKKKGAKYLKDFKGATMGRSAGVSVLRGVRPSDDTDGLRALHALITGVLVPLPEATRAWAESEPVPLPTISEEWLAYQKRLEKESKELVAHIEREKQIGYRTDVKHEFVGD